LSCAWNAYNFCSVIMHCLPCRILCYLYSAQSLSLYVLRYARPNHLTELPNFEEYQKCGGKLRRGNHPPPTEAGRKRLSTHILVSSFECLPGHVYLSSLALACRTAVYKLPVPCFVFLAQSKLLCRRR